MNSKIKVFNKHELLPILKISLELAQEKLYYFANEQDFDAKMNEAFGDHNFISLQQAWKEKNFSNLPQIEIRPATDINGAFGAYSQERNTIYLAQEYLSKNNVSRSSIVNILLEEIGHFVDSEINRIDSSGDEGYIFSALVSNRSLELSQLEQLKAENDLATITLDGEVLQIEQATISDSGGFEGSQKTLILDTNGGGIVQYYYEHYSIPDRFIIRYEGQNILDTQFVGGSQTGQLTIPQGNSNQLEVIVATNDSGTAWDYTVSTIDTEIKIEDSWVSVAEGEAQTAVIKFKVTLSKASTRQVTVDYFTFDGTTTASSDYNPFLFNNKQQLVFAPGETSKEIAITVKGSRSLTPGNFEIFARDTAYRDWEKQQDIDQFYNSTWLSPYGDLDYRVNQIWNDGSTGFQATGLTSDEQFFLVLANPQNAIIAGDTTQSENNLLQKFTEILPGQDKQNTQEKENLEEIKKNIQTLQANKQSWSFATGTIYDQGKDPVLAIRGTAPKPGEFFPDIFTDLNPNGIGFDQYQAYKSDLETWLTKVSESEEEQVTFRPHITGHSLGGALTQWVAANYPENLGNVVTFNSPGITEEGADNFNPAKAEQVTHYITVGDLVSMAGEQFIAGNVTLSSYSKLLSALLFETHSVPVLQQKIYRTDLDKPADLTSTTITANQLSSPLFTFHPNIAAYDFDWDYFVIQVVAAAVDPDLAKKLNYRGTVEPTRQLIGQKVFEAFKLGDRLSNGGSLFIKDFDFRLAGLLDVKVAGLTLEYRKQPTEYLQLQGKVTIPSIYNVTADLSGNNFIRITNALGIDLVGTLSVQNIKIVPNIWEIKKAEISIDSTVKELKGTATVLIPTGIELNGSLGFVNQELNFINIENNNTNKAIDATGLFLQSIKGRIDNIAESDPDPTEFTGSLSITGGPRITIPLPSWAGGNFTGALLELNLNGKIDKDHLQGNGNLNIFGGLLNGQSEAELNWNQGFLRAQGNFSALGGLITTNSSFRATSNLDITMGGAANVNLPNFIPFFGGKNLGSGNFLVQFSNDNNYANDFVAGWGTASIYIPFYGTVNVTKGVKVYLDGDWDIIGASNVPQINNFNIAHTTRSNSLNAANVSPDNSFNVAPATQWIIFGTEWENPSNNVQIRLRKPDGTVIEEADFATNNIAIINELTDSTTRTVVVANPTPGIWSLEVVDSTGLGQVQFSAFRDSVAPTIEVTQPSTEVSGTEVTIAWNAFDSDSDATISLFYDTDNQGFDGVLIQEDLLETDSTGSFLWNTAGIPTGEYYIYAMATDENNPPVYSYSQGKVQVTPAADLSVVQTINLSPVAVGKNFDYKITVTNNGTAEAKGVTLIETLSADVNFISASLTPIGQNNNVFTFNLGELAKGESKTIDILATASATGSVMTAKAEVSSDSFDPNYSNNLDNLNVIAAPEIAINDLTFSETQGNTFTIGLNAPSTETVTVNYALADETATADQDYIKSNGLIIFAPGETEKTIPVQILADALVESDETFFVNLSTASNAIITDSQGIGTIQNTPAVDLSVTQTANKNRVGVGQNLIYTVTVTNNSTVAAQGVKLLEILPQDVTFVSASVNPADQNNNNLTFDFDVVNAGESKTVDITVTAPSTETTITTDAQVSSENFDSNPMNNIAALSIPVQSILPDLAIARLNASDSISLGETYTYSLTVTNNGLAQATGVVLKDTLPSGVKFISGAIDASVPVFAANGIVTANLGNFNSGESKTIAIALTSTIAGNLIGTTSVTSNEIDANPLNNFLASTTTINPANPDLADLELTQSVNDDNPNVGDLVTFTINLTNKGPGIASGIQVSDLLSSELSFISYTAIQGTYNSSTGIWDVGNMRDNLSRTLTITAQVNGGQSITNTAEVTAVFEADIDSTPNNNNPNEDDLASTTLTVQNSNNIINGDDGNNTLSGTPNPDTINGLAGDDFIEGLAGDDSLDGGIGNFDRMFGGLGNDTIADPDGVLGAHGGIGNDTINVIFAAGWDNDISSGNSPRSDGKISGGYGDDLITVTMNKRGFFLNMKGDEPVSNTPQDGDDVVTLLGNYSNSVVDLGGGNDTFNGGVGRDNISGGNGNDTLFGMEDNDRLIGGNGNDLLKGGLGNDRLTGNANADIFVLASGEGKDTITDFQKGIDSLGLSGGLTFDDLYFSGNNLILGSQILATFSGFNTSTLTANDFVSVSI